VPRRENGNALAQMIADGNNNAMSQFDKSGKDMGRLQSRTIASSACKAIKSPASRPAGPY
jgi:hypothetical protein